MKVKSILCPLDFTPLDDRSLRIAVELGKAFAAHIELIHNIPGAAPGFGRAWEYEKSHRNTESETEAENKLRKLMAAVPKGISVDARISRGPLAGCVFQAVEDIGADLIILGSHGARHDDSESVTERIVSRTPCSIIAIDERLSADSDFRLPMAGEESVDVIVPVDESPASELALAAAFELARRFALRLHLLHVLSLFEIGSVVVPVDPAVAVSGAGGKAKLLAERKIEKLIPPDMVNTVSVYVGRGSILDEIVRLTREKNARFVMMGEHSKGYFKRFLTRSTAGGLLHKSRCPIWYVPAANGAE